MNNNYLSELNEAQLAAVTHTRGPSLIIAGAGAGKTRVLTYRIAHLLGNGVKAGKILALTFTNKAAGEMKSRISEMVGFDTAKYLWMGTFHSIFARILRMEGDKLGYNQNFTIYDSTDSRSLIRTIIKEMNLKDDVYKPGVIASRISAAKNNLVTASSYAASRETRDYDTAIRMPLIADIFKAYASRCFRANAMDFDDLLLNTNILLRDFPDVLAQYQERFDYILVDEYQDTNYSQYLIVKKLAASHSNLCVVGDDAQSIYSFRGARIENILEFKNDYPDYMLFKLEQNYRSTQTIVNAANTIINNNSGQIKKTVFSRNEEGEKIRVIEAMTDNEEGYLVANDIFDFRYARQLNWSDFAVLYRTNAQSRVFEESFRKKNIPYKIYGGLSFYERKEIKDILAYFRIIHNNDDEEALKRTINYPKRGIGDTSVLKIFEISELAGTSPWSVIKSIETQTTVFNAGTRKKIADYRDLVEGLMKVTSEKDAYEAAREIAASTGVMRELREGNSPEEISRLENFEELMNAIKEFTEAANTNGEPAALAAYLQNVALLTDQDNEDEEDRDKVTLMTIHSAKGLEFGSVYITGMEDTLFPSPMSSSNPKELEEERRLFYVAVTRARKMATLTYALNRYRYGNLEFSRPSRFLREIDQQFVDYPNKAARTRNPLHDRGPVDQVKEEKTITKPTFNEHKLRKVSSTPSTSGAMTFQAGDLKVGDRVSHERFGEGTIVSIEGDAPNTTASVDFISEGRKKLLLRFAKLNKI
ncbi:MAG: 3'-5' exonuclease [Bacteroidales bacterium]